MWQKLSFSPLCLCDLPPLQIPSEKPLEQLRLSSSTRALQEFALEPIHATKAAERIKKKCIVGGSRQVMGNDFISSLKEELT